MFKIQPEKMNKHNGVHEKDNRNELLSADVWELSWDGRGGRGLVAVSGEGRGGGGGGELGGRVGWIGLADYQKESILFIWLGDFQRYLSHLTWPHTAAKIQTQSGPPFLSLPPPPRPSFLILPSLIFFLLQIILEVSCLFPFPLHALIIHPFLFMPSSILYLLSSFCFLTSCPLLFFPAMRPLFSSFYPFFFYLLSPLFLIFSPPASLHICPSSPCLTSSVFRPFPSVQYIPSFYALLFLLPPPFRFPLLIFMFYLPRYQHLLTILLHLPPGGNKEMSSILGWPIASSYEPKWVGGELRGLSQWVQLCTWSPNKLWRSNSIISLCLPPFEIAPLLPFSFVSFLFNLCAPSPSFIQISLPCCTHLSLGFRVNQPTG